MLTVRLLTLALFTAKIKFSYLKLFNNYLITNQLFNYLINSRCQKEPINRKKEKGQGAMVF